MSVPPVRVQISVWIEPPDSKTGQETIPTPAEISAAVAASADLTAAALSLAVSRHVLTQLAREAGLDLSHMRPGRGRPMAPEQVFVLRDRRASSLVRAALLRIEPDTYWCESCGMDPEWNGQPITLELDHINGNPGDDRRDNLRWLCPNCHSQTETFRGRNMKRVEIVAGQKMV